jgi:aminoglycoside phosphotransferase (APT) family kinase protein
MSTCGDPLVDLVTLLSYWAEAEDPPVMHQLAQMPIAESGFPTRAALLEAYAQRTGRDLNHFRFYRVLCMLKLVVVFMQLHARFLRKEILDEHHQTFGALATRLLNFTEESLRDMPIKKQKDMT